PAAAAQIAAAPAAPEAVLGPTPATCPKGMQPAPDGLFDDFEDGTNQVALVGGRNGYWWLAKAEHASVSIPGPEFRTVDGGPKGSKKTAHFAGKTDAQDVWGASLGGNFLGGSFYDASRYAGVSFELKGKAKSFLRFKLHDVNTHPDGSICSKDCWNAFGKTIELKSDWQHVELAFADLRQLEGWGSPRPPFVNTAKVKHLEWSVDQGEDFDFWLDDVKLLVCK
ncbi:MAG TPA: hypothetical protein VLJ38_14235, partial [Polyangiaceae bacterium]|nr:hypothetical protein [Polyangiaceae bacterium]